MKTEPRSSPKKPKHEASSDANQPAGPIDSVSNFIASNVNGRWFPDSPVFLRLHGSLNWQSVEANATEISGTKGEGNLLLITGWDSREDQYSVYGLAIQVDGLTTSPLTQTSTLGSCLTLHTGFGYVSTLRAQKSEDQNIVRILVSDSLFLMTVGLHASSVGFSEMLGLPENEEFWSVGSLFQLTWARRWGSVTKLELEFFLLGIPEFTRYGEVHARLALTFLSGTPFSPYIDYDVRYATSNHEDEHNHEFFTSFPTLGIRGRF